MANSRLNVKQFFLPVYLLWAFLTPTIMVLLSGYVFATEEQNIFQAIDWLRVPSIYALFGLIWPLTIVISPAFYVAFQNETGYDFFTALSNFSESNAQKMVVATLFFILAWIGPVLHFIVKLFSHKSFIENSSDEDSLSWMDYLAGFI